MRSATIKAISVASAADNINGAAIKMDQNFVFSAVVVMTGSSTGTLKLQYSNDIPNQVVQGWAPTNWVDITGATVTMGAAETKGIQKTEICCAWIRPVWTKDNGSAGTISVNIQVMGA